MAQTPEAKVKQAVKRLLTNAGAYYYMPMSNGMGRVGAPDFMICLPGGRFLGVETKAPGKRKNTTANQKREIEWINRVGGLAVVIDSADQLKVLLDKLGVDHAGTAQPQGAGAKAQEP